MKKYLLYLIFILLGFSANAQKFGNEWINYNQSYYKFPITKDGIYRISYSELLSAGVPLSRITTPRNFQIYGRGKELKIYISNESTDVFGFNDYIEFYAQKNDGWYDSVLFKKPSDQANTEYSFFTDTAYYYFTWNNLVTNARLSTSNDVAFGSYSESPYFSYDSKVYYNYEYIAGEKLQFRPGYDNYFDDPAYANGEGWYDYKISLGESRTRTISTAKKYVGGPDSKVFYETMGMSNYANNTSLPNHHFRAVFAGFTVDSLYRGYKRLIFQKTVPTSSLGSSTTSFTFSSVNDINSGADLFAIPYIRVIYPHTPDLEGKSEFVLDVNDASSQAKSYFKFTNFAGGNNPIFYDLDNNIRAKVVKNGTSYQVLIPNSGKTKRCFFASENAINAVVDMRPITPSAKFTNYSIINPSADYIIISQTSLMNSGSTGLSNAYDYGNYRNSVGYNSLVVDIENLYDQYSYGIRKDPMAIRNFIKQLGSLYSYGQYKGVFIIGKSYRPLEYRKDKNLFDNTLVPTMGDPPSDILLVSGLVDSLYTPAIPIGRLSAKTLDHVDLYLNKMIVYEDRLQNPNELWMKRILHFSGGSNSDEQYAISRYLNNYKAIAEDTLFGGNVTTFYKTTTNPIQINTSDLIKTYVNSGVSMMTFFGHASGIGFDISIDNPSEYDNYGKYPFLLANSCYAGDIFQNNNSSSVNSSEEFVLIRNKGMIAYLASITSAYLSELNIYSTAFYNGFAKDYYGKPVGYIIQKTISKIQDSYGGTKELCLEMTLHGDPVLKINSSTKPDFSVNEESISYSPKIVSTALDSFNLNVIITNNGRAIGDSLLVEIRRQFPIGDTIAKYSLLIPSPRYKDTITVKMPVDKNYSIGDNIITVVLDGYNKIDELDETNNTVTDILNIKAGDLIPVYPPEFAVIPNNRVVLKASTFDPLAPIQDFVFEIDTTLYFNSPQKLSSKITHSGGVITWAPNIQLTDSTVYFWRVSLDSNSQHGYNWRNSSFQYILNTTGWAQAHFLQFKNDGFQLTNYNEAARTYSFVNNQKQLYAQTGIYPQIAWTEIFYQLNNDKLGTWSCIPPDVGGIKYVVFDKYSSDVWYSKGNGYQYGQYNDYHCTSYDYPCVEFPTGTTSSTDVDTTWYRRAADFLAKVPDGNTVMAMSFGPPNPQNWPEYLYKAYDSIGSSSIRNIPNGLPFIIYGKKGTFLSAKEQVGANYSSTVSLRDTINTNWNEGKITSPIIGPTTHWTSFIWKQHSLDLLPSDSVRIQIYGIKADGTKTLVIDNLPPDSTVIYNLNDKLDANIYPYCQLVCNMRDDIFRTPAYLDNWSIYYKPIADVAVDPSSAFIFYKDSIAQGDTLKMRVAYKNISDVDMDSLLVKSWIKDARGKITDIKTRRIAPVPKNSLIIDSLEYKTLNLLGSCFLNVEINPINDSTQKYDQLEITHINNKLEIPFITNRDKANPLLDVTFDGLHILDGDIVSPVPEIMISLRDENKYKAINDTSFFKVLIKKKGSPDYKNVNFSSVDNILEFIPAQLPDNYAKIMYKPKFEDGDYQLLVYANDASYNKSGDNGYKIDFTVINKSTITQMMNWPNPFSDKTHFVFTLTGSKLPDYMEIQIMTVTGKVVREIDMSELGPLHIGRNITDYAWDGRDQYGDLLANGVYIYRVVTRLNGESIENRESGADKYFKKNFGKMYLMR